MLKIANQHNADISKNSEHQALCAELKNILASDCENEWLADSAASKHMTFHRKFTLFKSVRTTVSIYIEDNLFVHAEGIGSINVMSLENGNLVLSKIFYYNSKQIYFQCSNKQKT